MCLGASIEAMREWGHADALVMQRSYTAEVFVFCVWLCYGMDQHCHACVGGALMQAQLSQGQHLTHRCRNWKVTHKVETGPAVAA